MAHDTDCLFVGIDAHQDTLSIAVLPLGADLPEPARKIANDPVKIRRVVRALQKRGSLHATYEAGCTGFVLWRQLTQLGVDCLVAAPSRIPVLPGEHRKTDRLDAERLAVFLRGGQLTAVRPPAPELEALRTLTRSRDAARKGVVSAKHHVSKLLLHRHLRRLLIETTLHYRRPYAESKMLRLRREQAPAAARELARSIEKRLVKKYRRLSAAKHTNLAKAAVARELVGHLWEALRLSS